MDFLKGILEKLNKGGIIAIILAIPSIIGYAFTIDGRYAHADDLNQFKVQHEQQEDKRWAEFRKQQLEDKIFELTVKQNSQRRLSPIDGAMLERYKQQLTDVNVQLQKR